MRKVFLPASALAVFFTVLLLNLYLLHSEISGFYFSVVSEETKRVESIIEGTVAGGGDPVEAISAYLETSPLLVGATFVLEGREVVIPGSRIGPEYYRKTVKIEPFTFHLYFDFSHLKEFNKHIYFVLSSFLAFTFAFVLITVLLAKRYFEEKLLYEREKSINLVIHSLLHEVKNKLNTFNLILYRLEQNLNDPYVEKLKKEVEKLGRYLEETADIKRPVVLNKRKVNVKDLISETIEGFSDLLEVKGIKTDVKLSECLLSVDPEKISSAIVDIVKNAIEALEGEREKRLKIEGKRKGRFYVIFVMDSGKKLKDKDKIFLPYYSTKKGGFGLGLYNAKRIVEAHGGKLNAYIKGGWTTFEIKLPI